MRNGLNVRRPLGSTAPSPQPIYRRLVEPTRLSEMVGKNLGLLFDSICELLFERQGDARMQPLSLSTQQGAIGRVLDQCMLEKIAPLRRRATLEDETGANK